MPLSRRGRGNATRNTQGNLVNQAILSQPRHPLAPITNNVVEDHMSRQHRNTHRSRSPIARGRRVSRSPSASPRSFPRRRSSQNIIEQLITMQQTQQNMINLIIQQQQVIMSQPRTRSRSRSRTPSHRADTNRNMTFRKVIDLTNIFGENASSQALFDELNLDQDWDAGELKRLRIEAVYVAMEILYKDVNQNLMLKTRKQEILKNVALSIIRTFPVLKSHILEGENPDWAFVSF